MTRSGVRSPSAPPARLDKPVKMLINLTSTLCFPTSFPTGVVCACPCLTEIVPTARNDQTDADLGRVTYESDVRPLQRGRAAIGLIRLGASGAGVAEGLREGEYDGWPATPLQIVLCEVLDLRSFGCFFSHWLLSRPLSTICVWIRNPTSKNTAAFRNGGPSIQGRRGSERGPRR